MQPPADALLHVFARRDAGHVGQVLGPQRPEHGVGLAAAVGQRVRVEYPAFDGQLGRERAGDREPALVLGCEYRHRVQGRQVAAAGLRTPPTPPRSGVDGRVDGRLVAAVHPVAAPELVRLGQRLRNVQGAADLVANALVDGRGRAQRVDDGSVVAVAQVRALNVRAQHLAEAGAQFPRHGPAAAPRAAMRRAPLRRLQNHGERPLALVPLRKRRARVSGCCG